jgi:uncharacterized protein (DUF433 family)
MSPRKLTAKSDLMTSRDAQMDAPVFLKTRITVQSLFDALIEGETVYDFARRCPRVGDERARELLRRVAALVQSGEVVV